VKFVECEEQAPQLKSERFWVMADMPLRAYIVEDDRPTAFVLQEHLELLHFEVVGIAESYVPALDACKVDAPDLILMDIFIDDRRTGLDLARTLRLEGILCPIIFVTGAAEDWLLDNITSQAAELGPVGCVRKPVHLHKLEREVQRLAPILPPTLDV
jgi:response regulator of citrate/malate metabolism